MRSKHKAMMGTGQSVRQNLKNRRSSFQRHKREFVWHQAVLLDRLDSEFAPNLFGFVATTKQDFTEPSTDYFDQEAGERRRRQGHRLQSRSMLGLGVKSRKIWAILFAALGLLCSFMAWAAISGREGPMVHSKGFSRLRAAPEQPEKQTSKGIADPLPEPSQNLSCSPKALGASTSNAASSINFGGVTVVTEVDKSGRLAVKARTKISGEFCQK